MAALGVHECKGSPSDFITKDTVPARDFGRFCLVVNFGLTLTLTLALPGFCLHFAPSDLLTGTYSSTSWFRSLVCLLVKSMSPPLVCCILILDRSPGSDLWLDLTLIPHSYIQFYIALPISDYSEDGNLNEKDLISLSGI